MYRETNFKDFYTYSILPFTKKRDASISKEFTRLLIAIEGIIPQEKDKLYEWRILVFPIRENGTYEILKEPFYQSREFQTIERVLEEAGKVEKHFSKFDE